MFLNTELNNKQPAQNKILFRGLDKAQISYVRNELDYGARRTSEDKDFDMAQLMTNITQEEFLSLIILTKTFRLTGGRVKCERLQKDGKLLYHIYIMGYFFAEIDCDFRITNRVVDDFDFKAEESEKFKAQVKEIAAYIKENVFTNNRPCDNRLQIKTPLNEKRDYEKWLEYSKDKNETSKSIA